MWWLLPLKYFNYSIQKPGEHVEKAKSAEVILSLIKETDAVVCSEILESEKFFKILLDISLTEIP